MSHPNLEPGRRLSDKELAALREDNARESQQAMERAQEARASDARIGRLPGAAGAVQEAAQAIQAKLRGEEFHSRSELRAREDEGRQ